MERQFDFRKDGIFLVDSINKRELAKITFYYLDDNTIEVNHTIVDESLRGQGIAKLLVDELAKFARENKLKVKPVCSYVIKLFEKDSTYNDIKKA